MDQLKRLRTEKGLSQAKLAALADIDPSTVNQIERGAREASPASLRKLAQALDVSLAELLEGADPKAPRRSSLEPSLFTNLDERREYPYPWMADSLARLIDYWTHIVESRSNPAYSRTIAVLCYDVIDAATLAWGDEWEQLSEKEKNERRSVAGRLDALAQQGFEHYKASKAAQEAEVQQIERRREEIRRRTAEISA
jgi:transcriptional regulator with XRE-family HTH domain